MKVRLRFFMPAALAVVAVLTVSCAAGKAGGGAMHVWPAGTTVTYDVTSSQTQTIEVPGMGAQGGTSTSTLVFDIANTGARTFQVSITDASVSSDTPEADLPDISTLIGLNSAVSLDERGLITEATGLAENSYIAEQGGVDDFKETLQGFFLYLPEGKLGTGVEWNREYGYTAIQSGMGTDLNIQINTSDTYRCVEETTYEGTPAFMIEATSVVSLSGSGEQMGQALDFALTGTGTGTIYIDASTGQMLSVESTGELNGGLAAMGMDLPMNMRSVSTVKARK